MQASAQTSVVDTLSSCQSVVASLERETVLAVDSEGVHLSRTGPLTLLQVATPSARAFLFDVKREPRMFKDGGLKRLLENDAIVKVLHSAKNDAEALYCQHGVMLRNVHDTQVAHREIQISKGIQVPPRGRLNDVCAIYCPEKASLVDDDKDVVVAKMNRTDGEYWDKRPLTQEMKTYAASDVIALVPEMYTAQKQLLEDMGLTASFQRRVQREIKAVADTEEWEALKKEDLDMVLSIFKKAAGTLGTQRLKDITDENVLAALDHVRLSELADMNLPPVIRDLKLQQVQAKLDDVEKEMLIKGKDFDGHTVCKQLPPWVKALEGEPRMKEQAQRLMTKVDLLILEDLKTKYTQSTPALHLAQYEKWILARHVRPKGENDASVNPVLLNLYWKARLEDLENSIEKFRADPGSYSASEGFVKVLKFYTSGPVPARLKELGRGFLSTLQDAGKVTRPQRGGGGMWRGGAAQGDWY